MPLISTKIVELAIREIGVEEIDGTNCGPRVNEYKAATNLPAHESWPWCAAFVCWLVREAMAATGIKETASFKRPRTAGAWAFEGWSLAQDATTQTRKPHGGDIKPGDIVIFTFSHIGIALTVPDADGFVQTVEGNTDGAGSREGGAVLKKKRRVSQIRSRIRFTI
jgi:hypothetical protein